LDRLAARDDSSRNFASSTLHFVESLKARHHTFTVLRLLYSVSSTTRSPRPGERDAVDFVFLERDEVIRQALETTDFLEWREYHGHLYGTPRSFIDESLRAGLNVIMKPGVDGALAIKERYPGAVLIFLLPDNLFQPAAPARSAADRTNEQIAARLEIAHQEVKYVRSFGYLIINEQAHPDVAVEDLESIVRAERFRIHRLLDNRIKELEDLNQ
jgi:guanylate kinase